MFRASPLRWISGEPSESERQKKEWRHETYMCKMFVFISHSMLNHFKKRRCNQSKDNDYFEVIQIGDLLLHV